MLINEIPEDYVDGQGTAYKSLKFICKKYHLNYAYIKYYLFDKLQTIQVKIPRYTKPILYIVDDSDLLGIKVEPNYSPSPILLNCDKPDNTYSKRNKEDLYSPAQTYMFKSNRAWTKF